MLNIPQVLSLSLGLARARTKVLEGECSSWVRWANKIQSDIGWLPQSIAAIWHHVACFTRKNGWSTEVFWALVHFHELTGHSTNGRKDMRKRKENCVDDWAHVDYLRDIQMPSMPSPHCDINLRICIEMLWPKYSLASAPLLEIESLSIESCLSSTNLQHGSSRCMIIKLEEAFDPNLEVFEALNMVKASGKVTQHVGMSRCRKNHGIQIKRQ